MGVLKISDNTLTKYFKYLKNFDDQSKSKLIDKLKDSFSSNKELEYNISDLYGKWEDEKSTEELISEIKASRLGRTTQGFE